MLLLELGQDESAAQAFQAAIQLAPDFAEAYASLAAIRARQGKMEQAVALGREAARHAPDSVRHKDALAGYEALLIDGCDASVHAGAELPTDERKRSGRTADLRTLARVDGSHRQRQLAGNRRPTLRAWCGSPAKPAPGDGVRIAPLDVRPGSTVRQDGRHEQEPLWKRRLSLLRAPDSTACRCHPPARLSVRFRNCQPMADVARK